MKKQPDPSFGWLQTITSVKYLLGKRLLPYSLWSGIIFTLSFYSLVPPYVLGKVVDFFTDFTEGDSLVPFYGYALFLGISFVFVSFLRLTIKKKSATIISETVRDIRVKGFARLLEYSLKWHDQEVTGAKAQRIQTGAAAFKQLHHTATNQIFSVITSMFGVIVVFFIVEAVYVLFFLSYICIVIANLWYFNKKMQEANDTYNKSMEMASGTYIESLTNVTTIKTTGTGKSFHKHVQNKEDINKDHDLQILTIAVNQWKAFQIFNGIAYGICLFIIGQGVISGLLSVGSIILFYGYFDQLQKGASDVLNFYEQIIRAKSGIGRMMPIFTSEVVSSHGTKSFPKNWQNIKVISGNFQYTESSGLEEDLPTLNNINLTISRNQKVGFVGKTGSGKSTVAKLLVGLYEWKDGSYTIGKRNFYGIAHDEITKNIALVLQDSEMFNLSLKDNITLLDSRGSGLLEKAIEISQLTEVMKKLPNGLDILIGEKGYHLSGGERQRVGIARAIYKNPEVFIFDEATSALDSKTEQVIQNNLTSQLNDKTIIFIAHRLSTLKDTDVIYVFEQGKVIEQGSFTELKDNKNSMFHDMYRRQQ